MTKFDEIKNYLIANEKNINRENSIQYVNYLKENYFKVETNESDFEKIKHSNELLNILFRFLGPWRNIGFNFSKQIFFPNSIEEITGKFSHSNTGLFRLLGFTLEKKFPTFSDLSYQLVQLGLFKSKLSDYFKDEQEKICEIILKRSSESNYNSYYLLFSDFKEDNKKIFKKSQSFIDFIKTSKHLKLKKFLKKYDLSELLLQTDTKFSVISAPWRDEEVNYLISLYDKHLDDLKILIKTTNLARETFGRSKEAVLAKLNLLINGKSDSKRIGVEINSRAFSSFPREIEKYFNQLVNFALLHSKNIILKTFDVLSYYYPYNGSLNDETLFVFIIPIFFKGNKLSNYNSLEQYIISRLFAKLINLDSNELIETNKILKMKLDKGFLKNMISDTNSLVGISIRKKFSLNEKMDTFEFSESIEFENGEKKNFDYLIFHENK